jgi:uncharacterized repeat protein (TIGR03803 family)
MSRLQTLSRLNPPAAPRPRFFASALCALLTLAGPLAFGASIYEPIFDFAVPPAAPMGDLIQAADLSLYGTTSAGGASGSGTVFKIATDGTGLRTVAEFTGVSGTLRGAQPSSKLTLAANGSYYGVDALGGTYGLGTVFKVLPDGSSVTVAVFSGTGSVTSGSKPYGALLEGGDGFLYGTTSKGGSFDLGTIFKLDETTGLVTTLFHFGGKREGKVGELPYAGLIKGSNGLLYGTTSKGGKTDDGTIFSITTAGLLTTLVEFSDNGAKNKGACPYAPLTPGADGLFYGTTARGGAADNGTVFKVGPDGTVTTLLEFTGKAGKNRGALPEAAMVTGPDGSFYGTTYGGGANNFGTIFKVAVDGTLTTLVDFTKDGATNRGSLPQSGLLLAQDGNFYGVTFGGGAGDTGTVFRMTPAGVLTTITEFAGVNPATFAQGGVIQGRDTNFYGVTSSDGMLGHGSAYRITLLGVIKSMVEFSGSGGANPGKGPRGLLIQGQGQDNNYYGVTLEGGAANLGTIFRLTNNGVLTTLVEFSGNGLTNKGASPRAGLIQVGGAFYGVTSAGGAANLGTIFRLDVIGNTATLTTLVEFTGNGATDKGASPDAALVLGKDGNFYGTTAKGGTKDLGTIFVMNPSGGLVTLVEFADDPKGIKGAYPEGALIQATNGDFYGTTMTGGTAGYGTIFRTTPGGTLSTLVEFTNTSGKFKGAHPTNALFQASDGNFYGITSFGGAGKVGSTFRLTPEGVFTTMADSVYKDGAYPENDLIVGSDGNLYSTTTGGGLFGAGTVFRLRMRTATDAIEAVAVSADSATLRARMEMSAFASNVYFEYGTDGYDHRTPDQPVTNGTATTVVTAGLTGLLPNTLYYYRTVVVDSSGTVYGRDQTFVTGPLTTEVLATGGGVSGEPDTTVITGFSVPSIADNQAVAVLANLSSATTLPTGKTAIVKDTAILAGSPPVVVARKGSPAPVTIPDVTATFATFKDPVSDATGHVAFFATGTADKKPISGLWTNASGNMAEVARIGGGVAGVPGATFSAITSYAMGGTGAVFYAAKIAGGGSAATNNSGLWAYDGTGNHLLLRLGDPVSGLPIKTILTLSPVVGSLGQGRSYYHNILTARVTLSDGNQAVLQLTPGAPPVVIGPTAYNIPDTAPLLVAQTLGTPTVSADGRTAFLSKLTDGRTVALADSLTQDLRLLAALGAPAPGTTGNFATFSDPVYNAQAASAFLATLSGTGVSGANRSGIWWTNEGGLALLARTADDVPGVPAAKWNAFTTVALPDNAGPVFVAKLGPGSSGPGLLTDVAGTSNMGIWCVDSTETVRLLVRTGQTLQSRGTAKKLSLITVLGAVTGSSGQGRSYNTTGDLVFRATFTDHSQSIIRVHIP